MLNCVLLCELWGHYRYRDNIIISDQQRILLCALFDYYSSEVFRVKKKRITRVYFVHLYFM